MYSQLYSFLIKYKILFKKLFEFKNNHFTIHTLMIRPVDLIQNHLDSDYFVCEIFTDFKKAFDTINHDILFAKLDYYGIRGLTNSWLSSFIKMEHNKSI